MSLYDQRESLKKLLGDANLNPYISPYSLLFYSISIFPLFGVCQECLRCYAIYTLSTSVITLTPYSIQALFSSLIYTSYTSTTNAYTSVTSIVIVVIPSSGAFVENPYAFWENTALFAFWRKVRIFLE